MTVSLTSVPNSTVPPFTKFAKPAATPNSYGTTYNNTKTTALGEAAAFANRLSDISGAKTACSVADSSSTEPATESWVSKTLEHLSRSFEDTVIYYNSPGGY